MLSGVLHHFLSVLFHLQAIRSQGCIYTWAKDWKDRKLQQTSVKHCIRPANSTLFHSKLCLFTAPKMLTSKKLVPQTVLTSCMSSILFTSTICRCVQWVLLGDDKQGLPSGILHAIWSVPDCGPDPSFAPLYGI